MRRKSLIVIMPFLVIMLVLSGCNNSSATSEAAGYGKVTESTLTDTVESSGSLQAAQVATLTWNTSGVVSGVYFKAGDKVKSDDVLVELDATSVPADVINGFVDLANAKLALEDAKSTSSTAEAAVALAEAQSAYDEALADAQVIGSQIGSTASIASARVALEIAQVGLETAAEKYDDVYHLEDDDLTKLNAEAALLSAQSNVKTLSAQLSYLQSTPDALTNETYSSNLELARTQLESAQRAYDRVKDGPNSDDIAAAQAAVDAAQATVNSMKIIAPFNGEIVVLYNQVGDNISKGDNSVIMVDRGRMFVEVSIDETSISNINVGDKATVSFDAFPGMETTGEVTFINPIGNSSSGVVNYTVRVDLNNTDPSVLIGATANITIQSGEPETILFVPIAAVQSDAQGEFVIRINDGGQERVSIVSGQIVDESVAVKGDLKAGDIVQMASSSDGAAAEEEQGQQPGGGMFIQGGGDFGGGEAPPNGGGLVP